MAPSNFPSSLSAIWKSVNCFSSSATGKWADRHKADNSSRSSVVARRVRYEFMGRPPQSQFGYDPRTLTKLQTSSRQAMALATLRSVMCPSQSTKKKYSQALRLLGRDSILVMFSLKRRNGDRARYKAPTSSAMLNITLVRSRPVGGPHWGPSTKKRVALALKSWMSRSMTCNLYLSAGKKPVMAATLPSNLEPFSAAAAADSAARALEEDSKISTLGKCRCTQMRHWARACGWA